MADKNSEAAKAENTPRFTVDTHLFRELGTLLVGRASTALVELIKNAYDADAEEVYVYGHAVSDKENGSIRIRDDGAGMTEEDFRKGFLRIASRTKDTPERRSRKHKRKFTGAKGIGRLAAHKLAEVLEITSTALGKDGKPERIEARIDWMAIEKKETLDQLGEDEVSVASVPVTGKSGTGTEITLLRLRQKWTDAELSRFLSEMQSFAPPELLTLPLAAGKKRILEKTLLFDTPEIRDAEDETGGFRVKLDGDFSQGDHYWSLLLEATEWVIEVDASRDGVRYGISPTRSFQVNNPMAERRVYIDEKHPNPKSGPFFQARILVRKPNWSSLGGAKTWAKHSAGIRVFMEGFRVLPYGEYRNDWLSIDEDYTARDKNMKLYGRELLSPEEQEWEQGKTIPLTLQSNDMFFGAVFLTESGAPDLQMLVNREGFVPDPSFEHLVRILRTGLHLYTRVRAAATDSGEPKAKRKRKSRATSEKTSTESPVPEEEFREAVTDATAAAAEAKRLIAAHKPAEAEQKILDAVDRLKDVEGSWKALIEETALMRVLASVGTQMSAFVHEIRGLLGMAQSVDATLGRLVDDKALDKRARQNLAKLQSSVGDLRRSLERHAAYLVEIVTPDARRRRSRQALAERFDAGLRVVQTSAEKRSITIENQIPGDLKSPPMFPAELTTVFSNLLSNAVKFAQTRGRVRASGQRLDLDDKVRLVIENTGVAVDLKDSERWFRPFESTTVHVDAVLGQGMGLGLTLTRNMLEQYGGEIQFIKPSPGFATAIEILLPL